MKHITSLLAVVALFVGAGSANSQISPPAPMPGGGKDGGVGNAASVNTGAWVNVSEAFTTQIGADNNKTEYLNRCQGMIVTPTGEIVIQTSTMGICVSKDQGATWSVVPDNGITGRCEHGYAFSIAYPYDGRMAFFCFDGAQKETSGGISLDGAKTWKPFGKVKRGCEFGDVDWTARDPKTLFAVTHEPFFMILSKDGGTSWQRLDEQESGSNTKFSIGLIGEKSLVRYNPGKEGGIIELSEDAGQTWSKAAQYKVNGRSMVHYGPKAYWTTADGVITSTNGKDWTLTGEGAKGASYGPYFGSSDQEFVVVTQKEFLKTEDGGRTWKPIANIFKAPDIFKNSPAFSYFGWDAKNNILYASGLGASIYKLQL